jgi:hypothetical protein
MVILEQFIVAISQLEIRNMKHEARNKSELPKFK